MKQKNWLRPLSNALKMLRVSIITRLKFFSCMVSIHYFNKFGHWKFTNNHSIPSSILHCFFFRERKNCIGSKLILFHIRELKVTKIYISYQVFVRSLILELRNFSNKRWTGT